MRQWAMDPAVMCDRHLLGEHNEHHAMASIMSAHRKIDNYIAWNLFNPATLARRHELLRVEMLSRNFKHDTPISDTAEAKAIVEYGSHPLRNRLSNLELLRRCPDCRRRFYARLGEYMQQAKVEYAEQSPKGTSLVVLALVLMNDDHKTGLSITDFDFTTGRAKLILQTECYDPKPQDASRSRRFASALKSIGGVL